MPDETKPPNKKSQAAKKREAKKKPTQKQSRFAKAFMAGKNQREAAIAAGYSPKYADQSGYQAMQSLRPKVAEMMDRAGIPVPVLIEKHLVPKLSAVTTKFAVNEGEFTDHVEVEDHATQLEALDMAFRLHGAYAKEGAESAQFGIKVVIVDVPRPQRGVWTPDVGPGPLPPPNGNNGHKE